MRNGAKTLVSALAVGSVATLQGCFAGGVILGALIAEDVHRSSQSQPVVNRAHAIWSTPPQRVYEDCSYSDASQGVAVKGTLQIQSQGVQFVSYTPGGTSFSLPYSIITDIASQDRNWFGDSVTIQTTNRGRFGFIFDFDAPNGAAQVRDTILSAK